MSNCEAMSALEEEVSERMVVALSWRTSSEKERIIMTVLLT